MKKIIGLILIMLMLSGCGLYDLESFVMPDDTEFMKVIESLDTPEKIGSYMLANFTPLEINQVCYKPYEMFYYKTGDCSDYSDFSAFVANHHGYEVYQMLIVFEDAAHLITVLKINGKYNYIDWWNYFEVETEKIGNVLNNWYGVKGYRVFDCSGNLIEVNN